MKDFRFWKSKWPWKIIYTSRDPVFHSLFYDCYNNSDNDPFVFSFLTLSTYYVPRLIYPLGIQKGSKQGKKSLLPWDLHSTLGLKVYLLNLHFPQWEPLAKLLKFKLKGNEKKISSFLKLTWKGSIATCGKVDNIYRTIRFIEHLYHHRKFYRAVTF